MSSPRPVDTPRGAAGTHAGWALAFLLAAAVVVRIVEPASGSIYPPCPFLWLTGWQCPGCGALRALRAITSGDIGLAWSLNPLFVLFGATLLVQTPLLLLRPTWAHRVMPPAWSAALIPVVIVAFWIGRNLTEA